MQSDFPLRGHVSKWDNMGKLAKYYLRNNKLLIHALLDL